MAPRNTSLLSRITLLAIFCLCLTTYAEAQTINSVTTTNVNCFGGNDGEITVNVTGPSPYTYRLRYDFGDGSFNDLGVVSGTASNSITFKKGNGTLFDNAVGIPANASVLESYIITVFFNCGTVGCIRSVSRTITEPVELLVNLDDVDPDCDATLGVGNGQIDISVTGGTAPYTIVWSGSTAISNGTLSTTANLDADTYTVTVTDAKGCEEILSIPVAVITQADAGPPTSLTCGTNSFALSGNAFGLGEIGTWTGPPGVTFSPDANTPTATANNLSVGNNILTWTITDVGMICTGSSNSITVTYSDVDITGSADVVLPCFGAATASGTFTVAGGVAPFTYSIVSNTASATIVLPAPGPTTSVNFSNGRAGIVRLQVEDASGCTDMVTITVTQPASPITITRSPVSGTINLLCNGDTNGSGSFTASGGTGAHTFNVTVNTTGSTPVIAGSVLSFSGAGAGTITVEVRDANNCLQTSSITISAPPALVLTPSSPTIMLLCNGDTNGSGSFTASGGTGAHTFNVTVNTTGSTPVIAGSILSFSGAGAGTITVEVRDANNCLQTSSITISSPPALVLTPSSPTIMLLCNGDTNGSGSFTASGGTGAHTFNVTVNTTGSTPVIAGSVLSFSGAGAGTITVEVRDANNCLQTSSITISAPLALVLTPSSPAIMLLCNGDTNGSGSFTASGGTGAHTFNVTVNTTGSTPVIAGSVLSFSGAGAGTITVEVRDANNCLQTSSITISSPPALVLTPSSPTIMLLCNGDADGWGSFTASGGTGAHTFNVTTNTTGSTPVIAGSVLSFSGAGAGTITVEVRDANNCLQTSSITISAPSALALTPSSPTITLSCNGDTNGSGSFTASGGTGAHTFNVTVNTTGSTPVIAGSVLSFSGATIGTITVEVRDANNCLQISSITITEPSVLVLSNPGDVTLTCSGGNNAAGTFTVSGGTAPYTFFEVTNTTGAATSFTATTFSYANGGGGTLEVRVDDANGCSQTQLVTVTPASNVAVTPGFTITDAACFGIDDGGVSGLGATGGDGNYTFSIDGASFLPQTSFTNLAAGPHNVTARDGAGCTSPVFPFSVGVTTSITYDLPIINTVPTTCGGNDATIPISNVTGGSGTYSYILNGILIASAQPANFTFTGLTAGTYQVEVEDDVSGCRSAAEAVVIGNPSGCVLNCFAYTVAVDQTLTKRPSCNGGSDGVIALTISGNPGNYIVSLIPSVHPPLILPSGSTFIFNNLSQGAYQYQISDGTNICVQSFAWDASEDVQATAGSFIDSPCFGFPSGSAVIDATGSSTGQYFYSVDGTTWTEFVPGNIVAGLPGDGTYNIRVGGSVNDPCYDVVSVSINTLGTSPLDTVYVSPVTGFPAVSYPESPTATRAIGIEESGAAPYEVRLELVDPYGITPNPPFIVDWTEVTGTNPQSFIPEQQINGLYAGEYQLLLRDALGCQKSYPVFIELDERIFIPNVFTPNKADDLNKNFFVRNLPEKGSKLSITDRWGKEVYASTNYNPDTLWDGGDSPDGVYFYRLQIKGGKTYTGWVEIIRGIKP